MFKKILRYFSEDIAIDLGTANSAVYVRGQGIVINEPSVVALNTKTGQILAVGEEAKKMVGRTPAHIQAVRPLVRGVVSDFEVTEQMLRYFIEKAHHKKFISLSWPRIIVGIPSRVTEVEKKAVEDAAKNAGAREVFLIEEPVAAAIGARLPIQEAKGTFIIDIGGGTTDIAVISLGGIVTSQSLSIAGDKLSDDIVQYVQQKYQLLIGERTAEEAKISIGCAVPLKEKKEFRLRGRNLVSGLPEEVIVDSEDIRKAMEKSLNAMMEAVKGIIESTPPELLADIMGSGIYIVGGGALLAGLDVLLSAATRMKVKIIEDPLTAVVRGGGIVLENLDTLREVLADTSSGMAIK
ncbi:rod shape-determining protein [bacterium (Candidatus Gribaldobacteria) CG_4_8_14_3_um_filter_42_11]|uniref:Cell shape-determining protein MreB n=3 Tax=Candidatus Gribaldobacteria TaxID=2798536 RepID=A0A2H0UY10_9BACT|nr:MAG: rod shape-determining protein [bacterium (Candidatus Gribaldobacteria) CG10_big_fil_rev_8_21_14_0_10_41_12]PIV46717.1 MAG: rod shape-determining protein [bacterium (Candidatus Gribaldobacteria) CG02_land_8_20_14_3_00_41_15]PIX03392.1 MAG: rod shape-determining protein [bacterium (Candidatus Gribaldobacteria) CG_4_8_14_3_um_filter_42_11]